MDTMPLDIPRQAGIYIRREREAQGLTRRQLAELAQVSERSLASIEIGEAAGVRLDRLLDVFGVLGISLVVQGEHIAEAASRPVSVGAPAGHTRSDDPAAWNPAPAARRLPRRKRAKRTQPAGLEILGSYDELLREVAADMGIELAPGPRQPIVL